MADTPGEERLEQPVNIPKEIISTLSTTVIKPNQETENMEVHKHPHHVAHKKKWGEYLLEFFMLFLAVFLGFVAENVRETTVEREGRKSTPVHYTQNFMRILLP